METVTELFFLDSKITADGDCSYEIKRRLVLRKKVMIKAMISPAVMHDCETWTIKKAECRRIDALEL